MLEKLSELLKLKRSISYYADRLTRQFEREVTEDEVRELLKELRSVEKESLEEIETVSVCKGIISEDVNYKTGQKVVTLKSDKPLNKEELEELAGIDNKTSFLERSWLKSHLTNSWTYSLNVRYANSAESFLTNFENFLKDFKSSYTPIKKEDIIKHDILENKFLVQISLADYHLDKQTLTQATLEERIKVYRTTIQALIYKAYMNYGIDEIVYVIGNDFFNSDNFNQTTTAGTQQFLNTSWFNSFEEGFKLQVWAIEFLKTFCNKLHVVHVMSNHDRVTGYHLAHSLEVYFKEDSEITFDRSSEHTKVYKYGSNFLGYNHGDTDLGKLPAYFASKFSKIWGETKHREISVGHLHNKKKYSFTIGSNEIEGIRINVLPGSTPSDVWYEMKLYDLAIKAGIAKIYDKNLGYVGEIEHKI